MLKLFNVSLFTYNNITLVVPLLSTMH